MTPDERGALRDRCVFAFSLAALDESGYSAGALVTAAGTFDGEWLIVAMGVSDKDQREDQDKDRGKDDL